MSHNFIFAVSKYLGQTLARIHDFSNAFLVATVMNYSRIIAEQYVRARSMVIKSFFGGYVVEAPLNKGCSYMLMVSYLLPVFTI